MIDPSRITNYKLDNNGLEENLLFWVLVAGKDSRTIARGLDGVLNDIGGYEKSPFEALRDYHGNLANLLKRNGIGCYNQKAKALKELVHSEIDLRNCSCEELEEIWGIGMKTSRCFLIHTRKDAKVAGLDTHILKFLRDKGIDAPESTPSGRKYIELEKVFLSYVPKGKSVAEFDLEVWNKYSRA